MVIINKRQKTITQVKQQFVDESFNPFARIAFLMNSLRVVLLILFHCWLHLYLLVILEHMVVQSRHKVVDYVRMLLISLRGQYGMVGATGM